jgi:phosphate transport system substrate-binding protein
MSPRFRFAIACALFSATAGGAGRAGGPDAAPGPASVDPALPPYAPQPVAFPAGAGYLTPQGAVSIVGYNDMKDMLEALDALFAAAHPGFRFALDLQGTRTAPSALARGTSAFAPMGAEFSADQLRDYRKSMAVDPLAIRVAHGSLSPRAKSGPILVFVHPSNPLSRITTAGMALLFASAEGNGGPVHWSRLGLGGAWADRDVHPVGLAASTPIGDYILREKLGAGRFRSGYRAEVQSEAVVRRVAADPSAIGFARANVLTPAVRILAVARQPEGPWSSASPEDVVAGKYPLDWYLYIYLRRLPGRPVDPFVREYLRLVLSREGQQAVAGTPQSYLPLNPGEAADELAKLNR